MNFFESAKHIEEKGIRHYTKLSENAPDESLKGIFSFLAQQEQRHYDTFDSIERNTSPSSDQASEDILEKAKVVFSALADSQHIQSPMYDYEQAYRDAYAFEQESIHLYNDALEKTSDPQEKKQLTCILKEEKKHAALMDGLCEFVKSPKEWLENAEWHHLDEY